MEYIVPSYTFFLFLPRSYAFSVSPILLHLIRVLSLPPSHTRSLLRFLYLPSSIPTVLAPHIAFSASPILSPSIAYAFSLTFPLLTIFYTYRSRSLRCLLSSSISYALSLSSSITYVFSFTFPLLTIFYTYRSRSLRCVLCYGTRGAIIR